VTRLRDWLVAGTVLVLGKTRRRPPRGGPDRVVRPGEPSPGAELWAIGLLGLSSLCAIAFVAVYALDRLPAHTQLLGLSIGLSLVFLSLALIVIAKQLVVEEEIVEEYPEIEHPSEQEKVEQIVEESGSRFTRKRLVTVAGAGAAGALGLAAITPAVSFGPIFHTGPFYETPWKRGRRLVDSNGRPYKADDIEEADFYTAYPEHGDPEQIAAPLVLVRLPSSELQLPPGRDGWAPAGILAFSKICTHAGCAISLYRVPTFAPVQPRPALVCPCHYSTFDPATGGKVLFGPAGRSLPQLPLELDGLGYLRAAGNFSGPVGPSWWGVRMGEAHS
jgi:ubiquinol-cytochrome c reductase iron-sulfur subunit